MMTPFSSYRIFSGGQIAGIVLASILLAGLLALNAYLLYLLKKRGEHKLYNAQLQNQRDALMQKLSDMRLGMAVSTGDSFNLVLDEEEESEADEEADESDAEIDEDVESLDLEVTAEGTVVRYNRSFEARTIQADLDLKARYSELKNYILSYKGVSDHMSWKKESFRAGRKEIVDFVIRGKTLCLYLATDPSIFAGTKYKVIDLSARSAKIKLPCMFRITSDRSTGYAKELVDIVMAGFDLVLNPSYEPQDFTFPYRSTEALVKRKLIKLVGGGIPDYAREDALAAAKRIRYNRSFEARIIQADDKLKEYYSKIKNHALAHADAKANATWKKENIAVGNKNLASFFIRGKTLCVCMALDPKPFENTKYKVQDISTQVRNNNMPLLFKVRNARRVIYAMELLDKMFEEQGIAKAEVEYVNYAVPFVATENLVRRGLIKIVNNTDSAGEEAAEATEKRAPVPRRKKAAEETESNDQPKKRASRSKAAKAAENTPAESETAEVPAEAAESAATEEPKQSKE